MRRRCLVVQTDQDVMTDCKKKPEIDYPCQWAYRVIGMSTDGVLGAVAQVLGGAEHSLRAANSSRGGKYVSFHLEVTVADEGHRVGIYDALSAHNDVKMVL